MSVPTDILVGVGTMYIAPAGTAKPALNAAPSGSWVALGETKDGVKVKKSQKIATFSSDQRTGNMKAVRTEEGVTIETKLIESTLENLADVINNTVTTTAAGSGTVGYKSLKLHSGATVTEYALLFRGASPYGAGFVGQFYVPRGFMNETLTDSKQLTEKQRDSLRPIIEAGAVAWAVASVDAETIDEINILNASILAMHLAVKQLSQVPQFLIIDGNRFKTYPGISHQCIVKGDEKFLSIAAASVLAKTHRDAFMHQIHREFPQYNWTNNKGYPSKQHRDAIILNGLTPWHRKSFRVKG